MALAPNNNYNSSHLSTTSTSSNLTSSTSSSLHGRPPCDPHVIPLVTMGTRGDAGEGRHGVTGGDGGGGDDGGVVNGGGGGGGPGVGRRASSRRRTARSPLGGHHRRQSSSSSSGGDETVTRGSRGGRPPRFSAKRLSGRDPDRPRDPRAALHASGAHSDDLGLWDSRDSVQLPLLPARRVSGGAGGTERQSARDGSARRSEQFKDAGPSRSRDSLLLHGGAGGGGGGGGEGRTERQSIRDRSARQSDEAKDTGLAHSRSRDSFFREAGGGGSAGGGRDRGGHITGGMLGRQSSRRRSSEPKRPTGDLQLLGFSTTAGHQLPCPAGISDRVPTTDGASLAGPQQRDDNGTAAGLTATRDGLVERGPAGPRAGMGDGAEEVDAGGGRELGAGEHGEQEEDAKVRVRHSVRRGPSGMSRRASSRRDGATKVAVAVEGDDDVEGNRPLTRGRGSTTRGRSRRGDVGGAAGGWRGRCSRLCAAWHCPNLKAVVAAVCGLLLCPAMVFAGLVLVPGVVPHCHGLAERLCLTVRCLGAVSLMPLIIGMMALSVCSVLARETELHALQLHFVSNTACHAVLHSLSLVAAASLLPQPLLKLVPVLCGAFAIARLIYWVTLALPPWCPPFGSALTLLPTLGLGAFNVYAAAAWGIGDGFPPDPDPGAHPSGRAFSGMAWITG